MLNDLLCDLNARYDRAAKWRKAWNTLANSPIRRVKYRLQTQQEYIERRAQLANLRIGKLMREYDALRT